MSHDYSQMSVAELMRLEREIARRHLNHFPWLAVIWGFGNTLCWLALWPLVLLEAIPLWLGFLIATLNLLLAYLPSHEAQHSIVAMPGKPLRWLNELLGHVSAFPLVIPFRVLRETHMEHHKYTNDPERDPDYDTHADTPLGAIWATIQQRQPRPHGKTPAYISTLERLGRHDLILETIAHNLFYIGVLVAFAWTGYAIEAALLWWLPRHLSLTYLHFFLSWAPHNPRLGTDRYNNTRSFRSLLGNIGSMGMQFHIVHHLHPRIPLYRTPAAYWEMKPIITALGAKTEAL